MRPLLTGGEVVRFSGEDDMPLTPISCILRALARTERLHYLYRVTADTAKMKHQHVA